MSSSSRATTSTSSATADGATSKSGSAKSSRHGDGGGWGIFGGYMAAKKQKLEEQFHTKQGCKSSIFEGVRIYVNGYTNPSSDKLRQLVMEHGGHYEQYLMKTVVTHIIATSLPNSKIHSLRDFKVVTPDWITDSIKEGRLLSHAPYKLFRRQASSLACFSSVLTRSTSSTSADHPASNIAHDVSSAHRTAASPQPGVSGLAGGDGEEENGGDVNDDDSLMEQGSPPAMDNTAEEVSELLTHSEDLASHPGPNNGKQVAESDPSAVLAVKRGERSSGQSRSSDPSSSWKTRSPAKAGDPQFVSEFYSHSRLHHISTWGAECRAYVRQLQQESGGTFPGRDRLRHFHEEQSGLGGGLEVNPGLSRGQPQRVVMHVDMDCFFVSVGLLHHPHLRGKPVAVTHSQGRGQSQPLPGSDVAWERAQWRRTTHRGGRKGRPAAPGEGREVEPDNGDPQVSLAEAGVEEVAGRSGEGSGGQDAGHSMAEIASCSYEARQAGVKNGMFLGTARQLCPALVTIPYTFQAYRAVSSCLYDTVASYTHEIEAVSCDEMLVDCTDLLANTGATPLEFAQLLRQDIASKTGCTASAGLGPNILLARLATRMAKPDGHYHVCEGAVAQFIKDQPVHHLPGVGWSMKRKLEGLGVESCGQLQAMALASLQRQFGPKTGQALYRFCRGHDPRPIRTQRERKSVSAEINYGIRLQTAGEVEQFVGELCGEVSRRLRGVGMKAGSLTVKLMVRRPDAPVNTAKFMGHGICNNLSKSSTLHLAIDDAQLLGKEAVCLVRAMKVKAADIRGVGIQTHRLQSATAGSGDKVIARGNQTILNFAVSRPLPPDGACPPEPPALGEEECRGENCDGLTSRGPENVAALPRLAGRPDQSSTLQGTSPPLPCLPALTPRSEGHFLLSPSQVDPEVLKELPSDIRRQIEEELRSTAHQDEGDGRRRGRQRSDRQTRSQKRRGDSTEPGCSHWVTPDNSSSNDSSQQEESGGGGGGGTDAGHPLSLSQVDPACMDALPSDLQAEIRAAYARQPSPPSPPPRPSPHTSPSKVEAVGSGRPRGRGRGRGQGRGRGRGRGGKGSPAFKVPRGRPVAGKRTGGCPRQLDFEVTAQQCISPAPPPAATITSVTTAATPPAAVEGSEQTGAGRPGQGVVSLCGAVTLLEVRTLLSEWLESTTDPQEEDVGVMVRYLGELVMDHNLEQVHRLLHFLHRKILLQDRLSWKPSLESIVRHTQSLVKAVHGCCLKTPWMAHT